MITRGLTPERDPAQGARKVVGGVAHYVDCYGPLDNRAARELLAAADASWRFVFTQFPGVDGYTHSGSPDSPKVLQSLRSSTGRSAAVMARLAEKGELDDTLFVLVSDHGATRMHTHVDLAHWFIARGVPTLHHPVIVGAEPARGGDGGRQRIRIDLRTARRAAHRALDDGAAAAAGRVRDRARISWPALVREPAVAFVAAEDLDGNVRVASSAGEAIITRDAGHHPLHPAVR